VFDPSDLKVGDGIAAIAVGDVLVVLWKEPASLPRWSWQLAASEELRARHPGGVFIFDLILASSKPPDAELRRRMQQDFERMKDGVRKLVVVALGDRFWQSVVRTIVRGVLIVSGLSKKLLLASTIAEGVDEIRSWASPATPARDDLLRAAEALRKALAVAD
jgi:hypothetical protein